MDPGQTAPTGSSLIWVHTVCQRANKTLQQKTKAGDFWFKHILFKLIKFVLGCIQLEMIRIRTKACRLYSSSLR